MAPIDRVAGCGGGTPLDRVLVIEDEPKVQRLVKAVLQFNGFKVEATTEGVQGLALLDSWAPNLVLLDIQLPGNLDGFQVCHQIRENSTVPVLMLTVMARENDKIRGFDAGADDYLCKPFSSRELIARVKAILRRSRPAADSRDGETVICGELSVNLSRNRVTLRGQEVVLTPTEYRLLAALARNAGEILPHQELLKRVWGPERLDGTESLRAYVRRLRRKIEENPAEPRYILSRMGIGYLLAKS